MSERSKSTRWFLSPVAIFVAILVVGPLAIPLVWMSRAFKRYQKWAITVALVVLTVWLLKSGTEIYQSLLKELRELQAVMK